MSGIFSYNFYGQFLTATTLAQHTFFGTIFIYFQKRTRIDSILQHSLQGKQLRGCRVFQISSKDCKTKTKPTVQTSSLTNGDCSCTLEEEELERKKKKERQQLEKRYTLPDAPSIIVHPNTTAKSGKFDCSVMTLSVLLDYRPEDNKEHSFEVGPCSLIGSMPSYQRALFPPAARI